MRKGLTVERPLELQRVTQRAGSELSNHQLCLPFEMLGHGALYLLLQRKVNEAISEVIGAAVELAAVYKCRPLFFGEYFEHSTWGMAHASSYTTGAVMRVRRNRHFIIEECEPVRNRAKTAAAASPKGLRDEAASRTSYQGGGLLLSIPSAKSAACSTSTPCSAFATWTPR